MARMFLVDGSNHAFRVQFALPPRHASDGFPTRVLYGFTLLFQKMLRTYRPDYCVVSFDKGKTFRNELFPEYKGHRPDMPEDLRRQWGLLPKLVEGFGYPCMIVPGFEADDVLGTLAKKFASEEMEVFIVTGDKDFMQLVDDNISIIDDKKNLIIKREEVIEKFGVPPEQIIDVLGLAGDTSDNIPGIFKVGVKTASKYVSQFGDLEDVIKAAEAGKIKGKTGERVANEADNARLSKVLATIRLDVPMDLTLEDLRPKGIQEEPLRELFDRWEFGLVAKKLLPAVEAIDGSKYRTVNTGAELDAVVKAVKKAGRVALNVESEGGALTGFGFAWGDGEAAWIPAEISGDLFGARRVSEALAPILADATIKKTGFDVKHQLRALNQVGLELNGVDGDVELLDYVLASHRRAHSLEDQSSRHLGHTLGSSGGSEGRVGGSRRRRREAAEDAAPADPNVARLEATHIAWLLDRRLTPKLSGGQRSVYEDIELPLVPVLARMEDVGVRIDLEGLAAIEADIDSRIEQLAEACFEVAGKRFNLRSRHELRDVLFDDLGLPPSKKVKDGWSTDSSVLDKLKDQHPLPGRILAYRQMEKLLSTYLKKLPTYVAADGRIHSTFNQAVAATGRLSSNEPNLQNIPIRTFEGRRIRDAFIPADGYTFVSADYSQVELRILAHYCGDETLIESFRNGEDIHRRTASEVFGVPLEEVTPEVRSAAKAINFGLIYGMSAFRLAGDLHISRTEAKQYMEEYFGRMPKVQEWLEEGRQYCRDNGFVETLFGRRRLIPEIYSAQYTERMAAEREAINTRVQGTAADIIKLAMLAVHKALPVTGARMVLQVHDELLVEAPLDAVEAVRDLLVRQMEGVASLAVPLAVNTGTGSNWNEAHG